MKRPTTLAAISAALVVSSLPALAQTTHHNLLQRHPTATGIGAAIAAHHAAKAGASKRMAAGRKPNFAERHPTASAVGAGLLAHHVAKHS